MDAPNRRTAHFEIFGIGEPQLIAVMPVFGISLFDSLLGPRKYQAKGSI
jgi:hypothetical protein